MTRQREQTIPHPFTEYDKDGPAARNEFPGRAAALLFFPGISTEVMEVEMKIYIWRHSKLYSSWSMFDEPHIYRDNYLQAEIAVLARSVDEALDLVARDERWNIEELKRIEPRVISLEEPTVISSAVHFG